MKVVIIGAGPAGLTAAYELLKNDNNKYEVTILEEETQVGGISKTIDYDGNKMDLGGHRFFTKSDEVDGIWHEILDDKTFLKRPRRSHIYYNNNFFDYPISLNFETIRKLGFLNSILCFLSYIKAKIFKRKDDNLENFYINRFGKRLYSIFFLDYTEKLWGRHPSVISSSWGSQRVKGLSITKVITSYIKKLFHITNKKQETSLIEEFSYPMFGPGQMWEEMAKKIVEMGGVILTSSKVIKINKNNSNIKSLVYEKDNKKITIDTDIVISSMPIKDLISISNNITKKILNIANNLPYRDFITMGIIIKASNVNLDKLNDTWIYIQDGRIKLGRIQVFNNWSKDLVKDKNTISLGLEYFCSENDFLWNMSEEEFLSLCLDELEKTGLIKTKEVIDYHREKVKKAYPAYFDSYSEIDKVIKYLNKINNLYCIGRNGQHRYNNMDHSMLTAIEAVKNITNNVKDKENIWNVSIDNEYLEENNEKNN